MKYTLGQLKADSVSGGLNGLIFGVIYSFFTYPFEVFDKSNLDPKYKSRSWMHYYRSWTIRMGLAFAILRISYNAISKQELGPAYELGAMAAVTFGVSQVLF